MLTDDTTVADDERIPGADPGWALSRLLGIAVVIVGLGIGLGALADNSFFTHLATGQRILDGDLPRSDPYTFTGNGDPWVVQSWFASLLYGLLDEVGGAVAIRAFTATLTAVLAGIVWRLSRPAASAVVRVGVVSAALVIGATMWTERPLLIGLVLMGVVLLSAEGSVRAPLLVPVLWVWVNVHGSYPLAFVALGALAIGSWLDHRPVGREVEAAKWAAIGALAGGIVNPYGPKLLLFPIHLLGRSDILRHVAEWQSPSFDRLWTRTFLVLVVAGVLALVRRPSFRGALPFAVFVAAALLGARNVSVAVLVIVPVVADGLGDLGQLRLDRRSTPIRLASVALLALLPVIALSRLADDDYDLERYPVAAFEFLEDQQALSGARVAHPDFVGNWLELRYGGDLPVFIDDRYELHDRDLFDDYLTLFNGRAGWDETLQRWEIDHVVWQHDSALRSLLELHDAWQIAFDDDRWIVACRVTGCR